jgi:hypothetical protein
MMKHLKRVLPVYLLTAMFIALQLTTGVAVAASRTANNNTKVITNKLLTGLSAVSTNDIWAVGYSFTSNGLPQTLTEHWNGTKWSIVTSPNVGINDNYLYGVAVVSTNDIWAVGDYYDMGFSHGLIEHWNGSSWSVITAPTVGSGNHLQGVTAVSQNNVWATGYYFNGSVFQTLIEHWNGSSWMVVTSPNTGTNNNYLQSLSIVSGSASDIWAVGFSFDINNNPQTLIEHWNGTKWSIVSSPNVGINGSNLWGVATVSQNDVWAVGAYSNGSVFQTLIEHWNGSSWSAVNSPNVGTNDNIFYGVAMVSTGDVWAVGAYINSTGSDRTLIEHWNGTKWSVVKSPDVGTGNNNLAGVTVVSASNVWSVGDYLDSGIHYRTLVEQWNGTKWSIVKSPK